MFFNAHHSPIGAFASFTFGCKGSKGGLGLELKGPANENLYIGCEEGESPGSFVALPFFEDDESAAASFDSVHLAESGNRSRLRSFSDQQISRQLRAATDEWHAGDLTFRVVSPVRSVPEPDAALDPLAEPVLRPPKDGHEGRTGVPAELVDALCPAVLVELSLDNRSGRFPRKVFFGYQGSDRGSGMRLIDDDGLIGVGQGLRTAVVTSDPMNAGIGFDPLAALEPNHPDDRNFLVGTVGLLVGMVPPGKTKTFRMAVCFHATGTVTTGIPCRYFYNRWFNCIEEVATHALLSFDHALERAIEADLGLAEELTEVKALTVAHSVRSYYGCTQLLELEDGRPLWIVNEGEYRMMNTLDLVPDQSLFELRMNPWTVRNELDFYLERYSYYDEVVSPSGVKGPGGLAFTHDMGASNNFSRKGWSGYEKANLTGCFSFMSCEELTNWVITACLYGLTAEDSKWTEARLGVFQECLLSLLNRDASEDSRRNGVMSLDSSRCEGGAEITTYDSLDASLGQARDNLYLAVKWWAALVMLEAVLGGHGLVEDAEVAAKEAKRTADTVASSARDGLLPAILESTVPARIIPVIESLVFPLAAGLSGALEQYSLLREALDTHLKAVLVPGICKFPDGGWKLSSTSDNSWLSKIYLCQYVASEVFGIEDEDAYEVHWEWLMDPDNSYFAWSDQMLAGKAIGSRYYPRGVTSILWTSYRGTELSGSRGLVAGSIG